MLRQNVVCGLHSRHLVEFDPDSAVCAAVAWYQAEWKHNQKILTKINDLPEQSKLRVNIEDFLEGILEPVFVGKSSQRLDC